MKKKIRIAYTYAWHGFMSAYSGAYDSVHEQCVTDEAAQHQDFTMLK